MTIIVLVLSIYLFTIMPKVLSRKSFEKFDKSYYAHRGLHDNKSNAPENSLAAFRLAVENDYGIELDVRLTRDGTPVVFHDSSLKRACGIDKLVCDMNYDELKNIKLFNSAEVIPFFSDVLKLVNGKVPIIIEFKDSKNIELLCETIAPILDNYKGVYCIESFNPLIVQWYKKNRPHVIRGQLSTKHLRDGEHKDILLKLLLQNLMLNFISKPDFIAFNYEYRNMLSYNICRKLFKTPTFAYTINSKKALEDSIKRFDYYIFEGFRP